MILFFFMTLLVRVHATGAPRSTPVRSLIRSVILTQPRGGGPRQITLATDQFPRRSVNTLALSTLTNRPVKRVIPASLAKQIDGEMNVWTKRLARGGRGLATVGCTREITITRGARRVPLCLDRVSATLERDFLAWYDRTAGWLE